MKTQYKNLANVEFVDKVAMLAMQGILAGLYSSDGAMAAFGTIAEQNNKSVAQEVSERAYMIADTMLKTKYRMNKDGN